MTNISTIVRPVAIFPGLTEFPDEFDPIELLWLVQRKYEITAEQFAHAFGVEPDTVYHWSSTHKCSRLARIRAATLKRDWGF
ncbi:hypothetical protein QUA41_30685 [Microcoleus sp. Pol11C1]|uniref:hypothetical protein n=1 Tax=unclassified Microcoleus TaxID=2642155 RepID=UPI002FD4A6C3